jgi:hypothetical protein
VRVDVLIMDQQQPPFFFSDAYYVSFSRLSMTDWPRTAYGSAVSPGNYVVCAFVWYILVTKLVKAAFMPMSLLAETSMNPNPFSRANSCPIWKVTTLFGKSHLLPSSMTTILPSALLFICSYQLFSAKNESILVTS